MPARPLRPCPHPGCSALTQGGRCPEHAIQQRDDKESRRGSAHSRGYTRVWSAYRLRWLREHPLCGDRLDGFSDEHSLCRKQGRAVMGTDVDHVDPHKGDEQKFWNPRNHQTLCGHCHKVKTGHGL